MIRAGILGAKGYASGEALRWLLGHPEVKVASLMGRVEKPEPVTSYFPWARGLVDLPVEPMNLDQLASACDAVFLGLPHTAAQEYAQMLLDNGVKVIDLSADFRFDSVALYEKIYGVRHLAPQLVNKFPYALPELFAAEIPGAPGLACPGCYPTATLLGLAPLTRYEEAFDLDFVVVNALSGVSGAGRKVEPAYLFAEVNESVSAYSVGKHRHRPEIEEKLAKLTGREIRITFTTHLLPVTRGILATSTVPLLQKWTADELHAIYKEFYRDRPFVRVLPKGEFPTIAGVAMTNFCDIGVTVDTHSGVVIVISAIDNLAKGAASQAVQGMNILYGLPETLGLLPESTRASHD